MSTRAKGYILRALPAATYEAPNRTIGIYTR